MTTEKTNGNWIKTKIDDIDGQIRGVVERLENQSRDIEKRVRETELAKTAMRLQKDIENQTRRWQKDFERHTKRLRKDAEKIRDSAYNTAGIATKQEIESLRRKITQIAKSTQP